MVYDKSANLICGRYGLFCFYSIQLILLTMWKLCSATLNKSKLNMTNCSWLTIIIWLNMYNLLLNTRICKLIINTEFNSSRYSKWNRSYRILSIGLELAINNKICLNFFFQFMEKWSTWNNRQFCGLSTCPILITNDS